MCKSVLRFVLVVILVVSFASAESYEDKRCKCVCPSPSAVLNSSSIGSNTDRKLYIANVPPSECNCEGAILPTVGDLIKGKEQEFCPRCECMYENRNTTIIKVVVIIVIWVIMLLVVYMGFLICLDPLINKRSKNNYQEHTNEEDDMSIAPGPGTSSHPMGVRGNVLNRVGHQQDKWKRQVKEQRRNIYDRHTILN